MFKCTRNSKLHDTFPRINLLFSLFSETKNHFKQINVKFHVRPFSGFARYWGYQWQRHANISEWSRRQTLPTLSNTRWLSRIDSISTLLVHFENIYDAVSEIKDESTGQSAADASSFLFAMENFEFIIVACLTQYILAFIRPLSVNLQAKSCDLILAYSEARNLIQILSTVRSSATDYNKIYNRAVSIASKIDVLPQKPITVGRLWHRANAGDDTTVF